MYDYIILGGGFYGCMIASTLKGKILLIEKEDQIIKRASCNNQARVHNGYHYPRNFNTAYSSHRNYKKFINDFPEACDETRLMVYPVAKGGKTTAEQFKKTYEKVGSKLEVAPWPLKDNFNMDLIEEVFIGEEAVFNSDILRSIIKKRLNHVEILTSTEVTKISEFSVIANGVCYESKAIISCLYAGTNPLLERSELPTLPLVHEDTVMPLVDVPRAFKDMGITIMDGEFFSIMPFPTQDCHSIHHVKYTPEGGDWNKIYTDVIHYIPAMESMKYKGTVNEAKTVLEANEVDDGRPILYRQNWGVQGLTVIVGGKLDNVYGLIEDVETPNIL